MLENAGMWGMKGGAGLGGGGRRSRGPAGLASTLEDILCRQGSHMYVMGHQGK